MVIEEPQMLQRSLETVEVNAMWFMSLVPVDSKTMVGDGTVREASWQVQHHGLRCMVYLPM